MELPSVNRNDPRDFNGEVVLQDGRIAKIYRPLVAMDLVMCFQPDGNSIRFSLMLSARICKIDDKELTFAQLQDMEWLDVAPITQMVNAYLTRIAPYIRGVG